MNKKEIRVGDRLGHFEILALHNEHHFGNSWLVRCDCGNEVVRSTSRLLGTPKRRRDKSCGCSLYAHDGLIMKNKRLHDIWRHMVSRCYNEQERTYEYYGGRGVGIYDAWRTSYKEFYEWAMQSGYTDNLTIDRIDSSNDYEPDNCRWVSMFVQAQNKGIMRNNKSGVTGVIPTRNGFKVEITRNGIKKYLGRYITLEAATNARHKAEEHFKKYGTLEDYET
ncbi:hypothetical protein M3172_04855 [Mesobacillus subterraneus]|uniref:hypothetical protein n=1 Tax=Mesobacillus subterraneus TaxID=285983 RepID=UPI00203E4CC1|nr:hypothetical protein [Mesobacillus subterraneus]MCM3572508.1 hypothetical protein [Mesobacillus subterraneus]